MRLYRALLSLYPQSFRAEYGGEMCAVFQQRLSAAEGVPGRALAWAAGVADVVVNAAAVHWELTRHDLRFTARSLARTPGFALTAVLPTTATGSRRVPRSGAWAPTTRSS